MKEKLFKFAEIYTGTVHIEYIWDFFCNAQKSIIPSDGPSKRKIFFFFALLERNFFICLTFCSFSEKPLVFFTKSNKKNAIFCYENRLKFTPSHTNQCPSLPPPPLNSFNFNTISNITCSSAKYKNAMTDPCQCFTSELPPKHLSYCEIT